MESKPPKPRKRRGRKRYWLDYVAWFIFLTTLAVLIIGWLRGDIGGSNCCGG